MRPPEIDGIPVETFVGYMKKWPDIAPLWSDQLGEMVLSNLEVRDGKVYRRLPIPDHMKIAREIWEQDTSAPLGARPLSGADGARDQGIG